MQNQGEGITNKLATLCRISLIFCVLSCPAQERKISPLAVNNFVGLA